MLVEPFTTQNMNSNISVRLNSDLDVYKRKAQLYMIKYLKCTRNKGLSSPIHHQIVYYSGLSDLGVSFCFLTWALMIYSI